MKNLTLIFLLMPLFLFSQNVGIGTTTPDASAKLEVQSTSGGVLIPRLTTAERDAIPSPASGLLVYNTENNRFEFYDGTSWGPIASASSGGSEISDLDGDTKVSTEMSSDEDKVRITADGNEIVEMDANTVHIKTPQKSTYIGEDAGSANITTLDNWNTHLGYKSGEKGTNGERNTLLGAFSGGNKSTLGNENVMIGLSAGYDNEGDNNTFIGRDAGRLSGTSSNNTYLGHDAGRSAMGSNNVMIGHNSGKTETGSNKLYIDNSDTTSPLIYGEFDNKKVQINGSLNINGSYDLPISDGSIGQALSTDGSGNVTWSASGSGAFEDIDGLIRPSAGYQQDFIVGRDALPLNGEVVSDTFFFFDKSKGAFMGGMSINSSNWSPDSIGDFSFGFGVRVRAKGLASTAIGSVTKALGQTSIAMGFGTTASGNYSTSMGRETLASGNYSTAMGSETTASGFYSTSFGRLTNAINGASTAMGNETTASGTYSTAMGYRTSATELSSVAMGSETTASGDYSTAMGSTTYATGDNSTAVGYNTIASGKYSTTIGFFTTASGDYSTAIGRGTSAASYNEVAIGGYNSTYIPNSTNSWDANDRLFVMGNGLSNAASSNAMVVLKNGNTGIGDSNPSEKLSVIGNIVATGNITANSDLRFKRELSPIQSALSKVNQLNGLYYFWNQDLFPEKEFSSERQIGVIAQEVEALFPEMVLTDSEGYKSVDYSRLTPVLIEAVKELTSKNELLESQMQELSALVHDFVDKEK